MPLRSLGRWGLPLASRGTQWLGLRGALRLWRGSSFRLWCANRTRRTLWVISEVAWQRYYRKEETEKLAKEFDVKFGKQAGKAKHSGVKKGTK